MLIGFLPLKAKAMMFPGFFLNSSTCIKLFMLPRKAANLVDRAALCWGVKPKNSSLANFKVVSDINESYNLFFTEPDAACNARVCNKCGKAYVAVK